MTIWLWIALVSNVVYWGIFFFLVSRRRWTKASLAVGVLHMIFASLLVVAPVRSLIDPNYIGYSIGFIRFEGRVTSLPSALILAWALSAAWVAVSNGGGRWLKMIAIGDLIFALNLGAAIAWDWSQGRLDGPMIQFGEHLTLSGLWAALLLLTVFAVPFVASALWAMRRASVTGKNPPPASQTSGNPVPPSDHTNNINGIQFSQLQA